MPPPVCPPGRGRATLPSEVGAAHSPLESSDVSDALVTSRGEGGLLGTRGRLAGGNRGALAARVFGTRLSGAFSWAPTAML